jgi:hypothetical protein
MPPAKPPLPPVIPAPLTSDEAQLIKKAVRRFYGDNAVVRNWGSDPTRIDLHVETDRAPGMELYDCLGELMTRIDRPINLDVTKRGRRVWGSAKLAYRQGVVL